MEAARLPHLFTVPPGFLFVCLLSPAVKSGGREVLTNAGEGLRETSVLRSKRF